MLSHPAAVQWRISEEQLTGVKNSTTFSCLRTPKLKCINNDKIKYRLKIYPDGENETNQGAVRFLLIAHFNGAEQVEASFKISINSCEYQKSFTIPLENRGDVVFTICNTDVLFNRTNNYITNGFLTIKFECIFKAPKEQWAITPFHINQPAFPEGESFLQC